MSLVRIHPIVNYLRWQDEIDHIFENVFFPIRYREVKKVVVPRADLVENEEDYVVKLDVPGVKKDQLEIKATERTLEISVSQKEEIKEESKEEDKESEDEESGKIIRQERFERYYSRKFRFTHRIDPNQASTELEDGVLTITLPKVEEPEAVQLLPE